MILCSSAEGNQGKTKYARVVELVDSLDSGSSVHCGRAGSSPASRTKKIQVFVSNTWIFCFCGAFVSKKFGFSDTVFAVALMVTLIRSERSQ